MWEMVESGLSELRTVRARRLQESGKTFRTGKT